MTTISVETIEILNDLIEINNDRIQAYKLSLRDLKIGDQVLSPLFMKMIDESKKNNRVLSREVDILGGEAERGTSLEGKFYRAWMNVRNTLAGKKKYQILQNCEINEDSTLEAYRTAIQCEELSGYLREMISDQLDELLHSHDSIKSLRDLSRPVRG
ncbi:PA2169 family four-helix-bundle protein [Flavitalea sp.]|nr:PA2169 family four-helix-bundle protein [Flavitalea sp.]